jgi:hypothetical protein
MAIMKTNILIIYLIFGFVLASCETAEEEFIGRRILAMCDDAYYICNRPTGCVLDNKHYVEGLFPGERRVVISTEESDVDLRVRLFLKTMRSPGTEIWIQLYEPDCSMDTHFGREHLVDVDLFKEAGDDRMLIFELKASEEGEHLLEIYSDASTEYLLVVEPI